MAKTRKPSEPQSRLSAQVHRALREGALYVFGVLAVILWFALVTYDPADPGFDPVDFPNVSVRVSYDLDLITPIASWFGGSITLASEVTATVYSEDPCDPTP